MKFRRGTITSPATSNVAKIDFDRDHKFDRRMADASFNQNPVKTSKGGSGSFDLTGGTFTDLYNASMVMVVEDVTAANGETITNRTFTFSEVTTNSGVGADNNGGEGSRRVKFEFTDFTES